MSVNRNSIFEFISKNEGCFRSDVLKHFDYLTKQAVYRNITQLIDRGLVLEDDVHKLRIKKRDATAFKYHPLISNRSNLTTITNAYYKDSAQLKSLVDFYILEHGEALATLFIDLFYLMQATNGSDAETPDTVYNIDLIEVKKEIEKIISAAKAYGVKQA